MFKIAVQTGDLDSFYGIDAAYRMIKEAGFDGVDANLDHLEDTRAARNKIVSPAFSPDLSEKEMLEYFKPYLDASKKYGVDNYQAHAPFPSMLTAEKDDEWDAFLLEVLRKTIIGAAYIGCRNLVIHPFFMDYDHALPKDVEWELNIERYSSLIPTAKQYGVTINLENMFVGHNGKLYAAICNDAREAVGYIDELNRIAGEKIFGFCLDVGHSLIVGHDVKQFMLTLGDRINCFHVHDNDGGHDNHQAPYTGKQDWDRFIEGLAAINYNKTLSFETFMATNTVPRELLPELMRYIAACGRYFDKKTEALVAR